MAFSAGVGAVVGGITGGGWEGAIKTKKRGFFMLSAI